MYFYSIPPQPWLLSHSMCHILLSWPFLVPLNFHSEPHAAHRSTLELQSKVRESFEITEKAPTRIYANQTASPISHLLIVG